MKGWVYVLSNSAMPGIVKIGYSSKDPEIRARKLGEPTGVPGPFTIECSILVDNPYGLEQRIHSHLKGIRNIGTEFFKCSPDEAITVIKDICHGKILYLEDNRKKVQIQPQKTVHDFEYWRGMAECGDAKAQSQLGWMYLKGLGVLKNESQAAVWYKKAAEQGNAIAQHNFGWMYANGHGWCTQRRCASCPMVSKSG